MPALIFDDSPDENVDDYFTGFNVSKEKEVELLEYAKMLYGYQ